MFETIYQGEDFGYSHNKETGQYKLTSQKYNIGIYLKDDDAKLFETHLELINRKQDETTNKRIEKIIGVYLYFNISAALDDTNKA
jgi:hypothetical protein